MNSPTARRRNPHSEHFRAGFWPLAGTTLLLSCVGCWQEVHYEPPPQVAAATAESEKPTSSEPPLPTATTDASAGDLFGDEPVPPPIETAPIPTAPIEAAPIDQAPPGVTFPDVTPTPVTPSIGASPTATPAQRRDAWNAASDWSLAAAMYAKGLPTDRYQTYLDEATRAAAALNVTLPPFPSAKEGSTLEATVTAAMNGDLGDHFAAVLGEHVDPAAGAAANLAIQSHLLLLTYATSNAPEAAAEIRAAGERSLLPAVLWRPLVDVLDKPGDFLAVRKAVFAMRTAIAEHLAE